MAPMRRLPQTGIIAVLLNNLDKLRQGDAATKPNAG